MSRPAPRASAGQFVALRSDLAAARFSVDGLRDLWGDEAGGALTRSHRLPAQRELERRRERGELPPAGTLAWFFVLGLPLASVEFDSAAPALSASGAVRLGLADEHDDGLLHPLVDLRPYAFDDATGAGEWWIASDLGELALGRPLGTEHVLGIGGASTTLSGLIFDAPVETALDLGTGCGIQALHVSRHAARVVATDISPRALAFAAFNAGLNCVENVEFRLGSLFEPVAGELFDQIVSNPPFVITPRGAAVPEFEYRDGGMVGDALVRAVVDGVAAHLKPGATAQLLGNWEYRDGVDGLTRVGAWLDELESAGRGLDAWVVERELQDAPSYAETWIRDGGTRAGSDDYERWYGEWLDDFERRGVEYVGFGYLVLRRPTRGARPTLRRLESVESTGVSAGGLSAHLADGLACHDVLVSMNDGELLGCLPIVASDVTEERHYWPGDENPTIVTLRQGGGFGRTIAVDPALAGLVGASDGELSIGVIIGALATIFEVDEDDVRTSLLPRVRELLMVGFLRVDGRGGAPRRGLGE